MSFQGQKFNMDLDWRFHRGDIQEESVQSHTAVARSTKAGEIKGPASKQAFDDSDWEIVNVPHDYMRESGFSPDAVQSQGYRPKENGWYRKTFVLDPSLAGRHVTLVFEGIATSSEIYLNGSLIRRSFSCYTEIALDITDRVYFDKVNTLAVYTRGDATEGWWYEGAGIYRHVALYVKDTVHIAHNGLWAKTVLDAGSQNDWTIDLETTVENSGYEPDSVSVRATLWNGENAVAEAVSPVCACVADGRTPVLLPVRVSDPERWDVDDPKLYLLKVELLRDGQVIDTQSVKIGFRTFRIDADKGFFLNGRSLKIKGACNHQDHACVGIGVPDSIQYYRIRRLKEMGCNAYRSAHSPHASEILDACDELGLIVMDENRNFETSEEAIRNWEITLRRDRNHPSVIFYSLFNEEPLQNTPEGRNIYKRLKSRVKKLDDTRLLTGAINDNLVADGTGLEMDVFGKNYGIYLTETIHKNFPNMPIIGSENNSAVTTRGCYKTDHDAHVLNNYDEEVVPWGQTIRETWKYVRTHDFFSGIFVWTGFDYRGEPTPFDWPSCGSQFGIMDLCGFPKDAFYFTQAVFTDKPMMHILPHWNWKPGETVRVMTVTNCDQVELFLNGVSLGRKDSDVCTQCQWQIPFEKGTLSAVGYRNGERVAYAERKTAGEARRILLQADREALDNSGQDVVPIRVSVVDDQGVELPDASQLIRFEVVGDGYIAGVGNGDPNSHEPEHIPQRSLYCGLCQVMVGAALGAKNVTLIARSDGLESAQVTFCVNEALKQDRLFCCQNQMVKGIMVSVSDSEEKPDATKVYSDNDMNSFAPIEIHSSKYTSDFRSGWREYRIPVVLSKAALAKGLTPVLHFEALMCDEIEIYANGMLISNGGSRYKKGFNVTLKYNGEMQFEVRALLKANSQTSGLSGISKAITVFYQKPGEKADNN